MKDKTPGTSVKSWPRLLVDMNGSTDPVETGFLQITSTSARIAVGAASSREFRLMQCLFSAQNFISAKYAPVTQTYERLYGAIKSSTDSSNSKLMNEKSALNEMKAIVQKSMRVLQHDEVGKLLNFIVVDDKLRMEIAGAVSA
jgi:hypothetical protein